MFIESTSLELSLAQMSSVAYTALFIAIAIVLYALFRRGKRENEKIAQKDFELKQKEVELRQKEEDIALSKKTETANRFSGAVAQLGSDALAVRLGGIFSLCQLLKDSEKDRPMVIETLCAFVRDHSGKDSGETLPRSDIDAALKAIGNRPLAKNAKEESTLNLANIKAAGADLANSNLKGANLAQAKLIGSNIQGAHLERAVLKGADLSKVSLNGANMNRANMEGVNLSKAEMGGALLEKANLTKACLNGANLYGANLKGAKLIEADFSNANLAGASLGGANLKDAKNLSKNQIDAAVTDENTILS